MRYLALLLLLVLAGGSCAGHRTPSPQPPTIERYVFVETLPDHVEICVRRDVFRAELVCLSLGEFRYTLRHMKRARLVWPMLDAQGDDPRPDRQQ
jgi:hypothetical protein